MIGGKQVTIGLKDENSTLELGQAPNTRRSVILDKTTETGLLPSDFPVFFGNQSHSTA